ncbi:MAG: helix-turn-helix transcriptional regulator [Roseburia sp.]|nr:helix-turn-helix transcriptional regulator [Roseburia sp.]
METIQITLAAARVNAGLTQKDVARKMKLNKQTICNWETGKVIPKPAQLEMMCKIYNIPADNIFLPTKSTLS